MGAELSATSRPCPPPDRQEYLRRWSALHGGVAPRGLVGAWLAGTYRIARPLASRGVHPDVITAGGLLIGAGVLLPAAAGGRWALLAVAVVVVSALLDGLDGSVAVLSDRVRPFGAVLDATCDRVADACYVAALWLLGAPAWLCVAGGGTALLHEYVRARATAAGMDDVGTITVAERPTRVIVTAMFLLGAGIYPDLGDVWAGAGAAAWTTIGAAGLLQLGVVVRRRLT